MKTLKQIQAIKSSMGFIHFNEDYEDRMEKDQIEMNIFLTRVSDVPDSIYNYVSTNRLGIRAKHKWC